MALAFAARYADDAGRYRRALRTRIHEDRQIAYQQVPEDRENWTGPAAPEIHFPIMLFWLNEEGYAMASLGAEVPITPQEHQAIIDASRWHGGTQEPVERESWQDEFDEPELLSYLTRERPPEP